MSWFIRGIIDMKMIIMSVAIEYSCYCILKPEIEKHILGILCGNLKCQFSGDQSSSQSAWSTAAPISIGLCLANRKHKIDGQPER
jgi:hypothetical protein